MAEEGPERKKAKKEVNLCDAVDDILPYGDLGLIDQLFTWKDWDLGCEREDAEFRNCVMLVDIADQSGTVVIAKGDKVSTILWEPSSSRVVFLQGDEKAVACRMKVALSVAGTAETK